MDEAGGDQAVDDAGDRAGAEAEGLGELARRGGPELVQEGQAVEVTRSDAELRSDGLVEQGVLRGGAGEGAGESVELEWLGGFGEHGRDLDILVTKISPMQENCSPRNRRRPGAVGEDGRA